ncbi:inner membrane protein [Paenisporosarcina quisquiliarum]|jgi:inner membrane protein|uniref:Metal-dependent hydrolase n=1 Tax=Psychrobacillus psychrodurans TaxID=126157 RepID=A0A9X3RA44_9BACI|nr:metal-dependent hydrolase [Psychrobacillus psychrodurans]SEN48107.1 inner membrane protein [Paenisporosarcina quisquiliarum]MCK1997671.1 metal-dependent hydrolase [Psychrobacillus psychrodurans]MCZ8534150.1 metal-dependent hydrolase [Psychrobacillus psychrodurans]MCZ8540635.1 metal-dependent hydrolase [Psychrobacillus psychrodurans]SFM65875.1 inner membrane protein [Psychrobacillus psychrodurans]
MDTGTHVVMGIALGGLSLIDPVVAGSTLTTTAVIAGTIIGSQAPDIDTVLKLRNNAVYIRHHRGITHSIPAVILWPILIAGVLWLILPEANLLHLWLWTFLAVFVHVFVDIFNSYGTQALRPFSRKWVALGVINTFDPIIFGIHVVGLLLWMFGLNPVPTFLTMYAIIVVYYISRFAVQHAVKNSVKHTIPDADEIIVAPTMKFLQWRVAAISKTHHYVGRAYGRSITIYDKFERKPLPESDLVKAALKDKNLSAFTSFSPIYRWEITEFDHIYEVRLIDLRYRSNDYYPFVAVAHLNEDLEIVNSYTGWIFSEDKLHKKLDFMPHN